MGDLKKAMEALQADLAGVHGEVTLGLEAIRDNDGAWTWRLASGPASHTIRWDLARGMGGSGGNVGRAGISAHREAWNETVQAEVLGALDAVFGPPGFDSGARATVFREVAADVGEQGLTQVLELLQRGQPSEDADLERARHGLARLLDRGPSGSQHGARILGRLLGRHGLDRVLDRVGERWRFGT